MRTRAYVNFGRWVADCPSPDCTSAKEVQPGQAVYQCAAPTFGCGRTAPLAWPEDPAGDMAALADLPAQHQSQPYPPTH